MAIISATFCPSRRVVHSITVVQKHFTCPLHLLSVHVEISCERMKRVSQKKMPPGSPALLLFSPPLPRLPGRPPLFPPLRPLLPSWSRLPPSGESEPTEDNSDWESFRASRCLQTKVNVTEVQFFSTKYFSECLYLLNT